MFKSLAIFIFYLSMVTVMIILFFKCASFITKGMTICNFDNKGVPFCVKNP